MLRLCKMDTVGFGDFKAYTIEQHAQEMSQTYGIELEKARESAVEQTNGRLSQGLETPGCSIYYIEQETDSETTCIGYLEYVIWSGESFAWLENIDIFEPYQNQGNGKKVIALLEKELEAKGIRSISLHVAAHNKHALRFYQSRGFHFTGHQMKKDWD